MIEGRHVHHKKFQKFLNSEIQYDTLSYSFVALFSRPLSCLLQSNADHYEWNNGRDLSDANWDTDMPPPVGLAPPSCLLLFLSGIQHLFYIKVFITVELKF